MTKQIDELLQEIRNASDSDAEKLQLVLAISEFLSGVYFDAQEKAFTKAASTVEGFDTMESARAAAVGGLRVFNMSLTQAFTIYRMFGMSDADVRSGLDSIQADINEIFESVIEHSARAAEDPEKHGFRAVAVGTRK